MNTLKSSWPATIHTEVEKLYAKRRKVMLSIERAGIHLIFMTERICTVKELISKMDGELVFAYMILYAKIKCKHYYFFRFHKLSKNVMLY